jgi:chromosome segregation ATPase
MSQHIIFDRTRYTDKLRDNGVDEKTARAHSDALDGALRDAVATKTDLQAVETTLKTDLQELEKSLTTELHELEGRMNINFADIDGKFADISVKFAEQNTKFAEQNAKIETAKLDILRWLIATQLALAGLVIGVMLKFMNSANPLR